MCNGEMKRQGGDVLWEGAKVGPIVAAGVEQITCSYPVRYPGVGNGGHGACRAGRALARGVGWGWGWREKWTAGNAAGVVHLGVAAVVEFLRAGLA